jgi:hypothetical protein
MKTISGNGSLILNVDNWKKTNEKLANCISDDHHLSDPVRHLMPVDAPMNRPDFVYVPACRTDISVTWRRAGWTPPSENRNGK